MSSNEKVGLFIGRFQPTHLGHLDAVNQAISKGITKVLIGIGSSNKEGTAENPFNFEERKQMVSMLLADVLNFDHNDIYQIPDFGDDKKWRGYILRSLPKFDYVITGNPWVKQIFESIEIPCILLEYNLPIKASIVRKQIAMGKKEILKKSLPEHIIKYLDTINGYSRLKEIYKMEYVQPSIAVDGIIEDEEGKLVLIERTNEPLGWALPGGFVDYGESAEQALVREMKEELGVDVEIQSIGKPYSEPDRDPRGHVISLVYRARIVGGQLKAGDDAKSFRKVGVNEIDSIHLAFDHYKIIKENCFVK